MLTRGEVYTITFASRDVLMRFIRDSRRKDIYEATRQELCRRDTRRFRQDWTQTVTNGVSC